LAKKDSCEDGDGWEDAFGFGWRFLLEFEDFPFGGGCGWDWVRGFVGVGVGVGVVDGGDGGGLFVGGWGVDHLGEQAWGDFEFDGSAARVVEQDSAEDVFVVVFDCMENAWSVPVIEDDKTGFGIVEDEFFESFEIFDLFPVFDDGVDFGEGIGFVPVKIVNFGPVHFLFVGGVVKGVDDGAREQHGVGRWFLKKNLNNLEDYFYCYFPFCF
jgi:hypothetical protein